MLTLANPLGLLALLGIPAILAIHFLQRKGRELPVSTLFLLERAQRDATSGRRIDRLIPSVPLWMQLLAVLLLAWFLAEPRYQKSQSVQRIAIVIDSSASMGVFKAGAIRQLNNSIPKMQGTAAALELTVLESAPARARLYTGTSITELCAILEKWQPLDGLNDPAQALRLARSLVSRDGIVIYLTDTPNSSLPYEAKLISVGEPIENVGFTGISFTTEDSVLVWRALVKNYGRSVSERTWVVQTATGKSEPRPIRLEPGAMVTLQSAFPVEAEEVKVVLSADRFTLDDTLPLVAPRPKPLNIFTATSPAFASLTQKLLRSIDTAIPTEDTAAADLSIASYDPLDPILPPGNSVIFVEDSTLTGAYLRGGIVAEPHPFLEGLNWQSLLVRETIELDRLTTDKVILWQDKRPLIFLRETKNARQLCFNFDLRLSNAENLPAFIILLHRFAESIRDRKIAPSSAILETGQPLRITTSPILPLLITSTDLTGKPSAFAETSRTAPLTPGFLTATQNGATLLNAAVYFADIREADFSECAKSEDQKLEVSSTVELHTRPDPLWRIWILALLAAMLVSWNFTTGKAIA